MKLRAASSTERFIEAYFGSLPHAVLLSGRFGVGLKTLAMHLATNGGTVLAVVSPESKSSSVPSISVERIRELYSETKSRLKGKNFVIIDDADAMGTPAQNALLKLLEEPNESICFILTSHYPDKLLPTIRSRAQGFVVAPVSELDSRRLVKSFGVSDPTTEQRILFVAGGLPAEITRLLTSETDFKKLLERVQQAKSLIEGSTYERITASMRLGADRQEALRIIDMTLLLLRRSLSAAPNTSTMEAIARFIAASESIKANGSIKLHMTRAVVQ